MCWAQQGTNTGMCTPADYVLCQNLQLSPVKLTSVAFPSWLLFIRRSHERGLSPLLEPSWLSWGAKIGRDIWMEVQKIPVVVVVFFSFPAPFPITKYPNLDTSGFLESVIIMKNTCHDLYEKFYPDIPV